MTTKEILKLWSEFKIAKQFSEGHKWLEKVYPTQEFLEKELGLTLYRPWHFEKKFRRVRKLGKVRAAL